VLVRGGKDTNRGTRHEPREADVTMVTIGRRDMTIA
jgi:hypothetical protein